MQWRDTSMSTTAHGCCRSTSTPNSSRAPSPTPCTDLVDRLDLGAFDAHYCNDSNGAPTHSPSMLVKAVLLGYSEGIVSSRAIERACRDNAANGDTQTPADLVHLNAPLSDSA